MINSKMPIIKTKFLPPLFRDTFVIRPRQIKKLRLAYEYPLTLVHAGPGYGKSAALSSFTREIASKYCWYTISQQEDEFFLF